MKNTINIFKAYVIFFCLKMFSIVLLYFHNKRRESALKYYIFWQLQRFVIKMSNNKRPVKSKFIVEDLSDFCNNSEFLNNSPKNEKSKRQRSDIIEQNTNVIVKNLSTSKQKNVASGFQLCGEFEQKILNVMDGQFEARKHINKNVLKSFLDTITQMETDYNVVKDSEQNLEQLMGSFLKSMQQATAAHKQKLEMFRNIHAIFKKECEEAEALHKAEIGKLSEDLEQDMKRYKEKLVADTKRNGWESLRRTFIEAMQNDF